MSLKFSKISKRNGDQWILRDASFEAAEKEIFGLLGENEKAAILNLAAGLEKPTMGEIVFSQSESANTSQNQQISMFPALAEIGIWKKIFKSYSTKKNFDGEKFKSDFENILNNSENILLLDNPFCCLDENLRDKIFKKLRKTVKEKKLIVILSTNNVDEAFALCDRIGILRQGEIVQIGTPRELYEKPNSIAVAAALGRNNLIKAMRVSFTNQNSQEFQTLNGDHRLQTDKTEKRLLGAINSAVTLAIRPEHISISFGASFPEDNLLKAKIAEVQYRGATTRVLLDANGLILEALVLRLVGLNIGDECMVGLPPDRIRILKD